MKILASTSTEGVCAIRSRVNTNVEKVVAEELEELLRGLQGGSSDVLLHPSRDSELTIGALVSVMWSPEVILRNKYPEEMQDVAIQSASARTAQRCASDS